MFKVSLCQIPNWYKDQRRSVQSQSLMPAACTQQAFPWEKAQLRFVALASARSLKSVTKSIIQSLLLSVMEIPSLC